MDRDLLNDEHWQRIAPLLPGKVGDPGRRGADNRLFIEAVLWLVRAGAAWRDLPPRFGKWGTVWKRFRRWAEKDVFERIFAALSGDPDFEYALIDGAIVKVHRHGAGAREGLKIKAPRQRRHRAAAARHLDRGADRRQALRQRVAQGTAQRTRRPGGDPAQRQPRRNHPLRQGNVQMAPLDRKPLSENHGAPAYRHPLRLPVRGRAAARPTPNRSKSSVGASAHRLR